MSNQHDYDEVEVHGVRDLNKEPGGYPGCEPDETCCEMDDENPQFFSVYGHLKEGGCECFGDFSTRDLANQYARELSAKYGWEFRQLVSL